jgi:hypothetical protein
MIYFKLWGSTTSFQRAHLKINYIIKEKQKLAPQKLRSKVALI